jgi:hypothetical protein
MVVAAALTGLVCANVKAKTEQRIYKKVASSTAEAAKPVPPKIPEPLRKIAYCESDNMQEKNGHVVIGKATGDIGRYQINPSNIPAAKARGWNVYTDAGNTAFALWLYKHNGTKDWNSSKNCWTSVTELRKHGYTQAS